MSPIQFLRRVLALDAASCLVMAVMLIGGAEALAGLFAVPEPVVTGAGVALAPIGLIIGWLASRPRPAALLVWLVIVGNLGWVAQSVGALMLFAETPLGTAFIAGQAAFVLALAVLEYLGVKRLAAAAAA